MCFFLCIFDVMFKKYLSNSRSQMLSDLLFFRKCYNLMFSSVIHFEFIYIYVMREGLMLCAFTMWGFCLPAKTLLSQGYISHIIESSVERSIRHNSVSQLLNRLKSWHPGQRTYSFYCFSNWTSYVCVAIVWLLSCVRLFCYPMDCGPPGSSVHGALQARILELDCYILFQGIFPTWGSNPHLLCCRQILYCWATREAPCLNYCHSCMWFFFFKRNTEKRKQYDMILVGLT